MIPKLNRGHSFKGLTAYLMHDKREGGAEAGEAHPDTAERVGFTRTMNFPGHAAQGDTRTAARIMALTCKSAEALKRAAGIKPGGSEAEAPPVWHSSLSWAKSERPDEAEMIRAAESYLKHQGLGLEKGYQTYLVEHTDTEHMHVHVVVNLVHPENGKQANPYRDQQKAQAWARTYEKQRGQIFCHDREAKYAELDRARSSHATPARAAFNDNAQGPAAPAAAQPDKLGRSRDRQPRKRNQQRPEWQARKAAGNDNRAAKEAADRIKADSAARWSALKAGQTAAFTQRTAEASRFYTDRKAGRDAIFEKYRTALDGIWKPQPGPTQASPDRSRLWQSIRQQQEQRQTTFEANEKTALGRVRNALTLAGKGSSLFRTARLAVNAGERRRVFERGQRAIVARTLPREERQPTRLTPKTPEPKRVQAERLKAMRTKELTEFARDTTTRAAAMKGRHAFQITGEKDARAVLSKDIKTAWRQHEAAHGAKEAQAPARTEAEKITRSGKHEPAPAKAGDRFGRSRDRQRQPRQQARRDATTGQEIETPASIGAEAGNSPVEAGYLSAQFPTPEQQNAPETQPEAAQQPNPAQEPESTPKTSWTPEEREAAINAEREAREAREAQERERGDDDPGREIE
jgi:hypothetical protein